MRNCCSLQHGERVVAIRAGLALGVSYDEGTIGVIEVIHVSGDTQRNVRFTRSKVFDFSYFEKRNWDVLTHCETCQQPILESAEHECEGAGTNS